jgi:riboflavin kinase/FMN adenylyltransferase
MEYTIKGTVVAGRRLGRQLGFPTANITCGDTPGVDDGVYAVCVDVNGKSYRGMANIGYKPSIGSSDRLLEVNIFDFDEDIYGYTIDVTLLKYLRHEKRFTTLDELREAIDRDRLDTEEYFKLKSLY